MLYRQFRPDPRLAAHVHCLWHLRKPAATAVAPDRVLPDGCMELVFNRATPLQLRSAAGRFERQPPAMLVGQISTHVLLQSDEATEVVAVRFRPAGARAFFREESDAFTDRCVPLDALGDGWRELADRVAEASTADDALGLVQGALVRRLEPSRTGVPSRALGALRLLHQPESAPSIGGIARALALSPRQLERIFRRDVGLSPKLYARLLRFRRMVGALDRGDPRWADLAARAGYSDQAHLVREFRAFAGVTPGRYLAEQTPFATALLG
jgi:AraC-like DNA-binding protein